MVLEQDRGWGVAASWQAMTAHPSSTTSMHRVCTHPYLHLLSLVLHGNFFLVLPNAGNATDYHICACPNAAGF